MADSAHAPVTIGGDAASSYMFGPFSLDPVRRSLTLDGRAIGLPPRPFDVLVCLLDNAGRTVERAELARAVWGCRVVEDGTLRQTVYEVRKALEQGGGAPMIATVPLRGYRLSVPVQRVVSAAPAPQPRAGARRLSRAAWRGVVLAGTGLAAASLAVGLVLPVRHMPAAALPSSATAVLGTDPALGGTRNPAAYDAYLRGLRYARGTDDKVARQAARGAFETAIALDPGFAMARAWRARELGELYDESGNATPAQSAPLLREAAEEAGRALAIAPTLGIAHLARAGIAVARQDFVEAEREIVLAREYAPNDLQVLLDDVYLEVEFHHPNAALRAAELGISLDPLAASAYTALGYAQQAVHDYDGALASLRHARLLGANSAAATMISAIVAFERSDNRTAAQDCARGPGGWMGELCLAVAEYRLGHAGQAARHMTALRNALGDNGAFQYAEVYAQWSQPDEALKWLDAAYRAHDAGLAMMKTDTFLTPIRHTAQFAEIERKLRFPP